MRVSRTRSLVALLGLAIFGNGCDEPTGPPAPGAIMVEVHEEGTDAPHLGYLSAVDNGTARALDSPSLRTTFTNIEPGAHAVWLEGLAPNCSVVGQNPVSVPVVSNETTFIRFNVSCVAHVGTVRVTTVTTGGDQDPNGYLAMVDGVQRAAVGVNAAVAISDVRVGQHAISLGDVAPNCTAVPLPAIVNVAFQGTVEALFDIQCVVSGTLQVTVATTGDDLDPNGYTIDVRAASLGFAGIRTVTPNGSVTFASLRPGADYRVTLQGVAENCDVVGASVQTVTVTSGGTTSVTFDVACMLVPLLAFVRDGDILVIASNGTGATRLTTDPAFDGDPAWSSTGRLAFTTRRHGNDPELYVMNADGTNLVRITTSAGFDESPSWSPNGGKIAFRSTRDLNAEIYVVSADGTGLTRLTNNTAEDNQPAWSSTGKIAFVSDRDHSAGEIYVMNEDGSNVVRITNNHTAETSPAWSPDGSMIAFVRTVECSDYYYQQYCKQDLLVMNADGSNERRLVTGQGSALSNSDPSWSPSGQAIAFTRVDCPFYCDPPAVWIVDVDGTAPVLVATHAANPAWKP